MDQSERKSGGKPENRDFINIDLRSGRDPEDAESREKREKYLKDLARLQRIREEARRKEPEKFRRPEKTDARNPEPERASSGPAFFPYSDASVSRAAEKAPASTRKTARSMGADKSKKRRRHIFRNLLRFCFIFLLCWGVKSLFFGSGVPLTHETGYYTVAVFGVDSRDGALGKGALADVNMLVSLNRETGDIRIASVYRDTFVQINQDGRHHKFNEAYMIGGPEQALWTMCYNLGVTPDDYVTFNWKAVVDAVNIMGGVDIDITKAEFKYINSFITETVKSTGIGSVQLKHAGQNHLDGVQAVAYARLRLMDTDFNRTERQRKVISLLMDKIRAADLPKRIELVTSVLPETKTSMTVNDLLTYARDVKKYHIAETTGFPFEKETGWIEKKDCVIPVTLEANGKELHAFLYGAKDYRVPSSVREVSEYIIKKTGLTEADWEKARASSESEKEESQK